MIKKYLCEIMKTSYLFQRPAAESSASASETAAWSGTTRFPLRASAGVSPFAAMAVGCWSRCHSQTLLVDLCFINLINLCTSVVLFILMYPYYLLGR